MTKCGSRSYDSSGVEGTSPGELAVLCPACPLPSINLPTNWRSIRKDLEFVFPLQAFAFVANGVYGRYLYYQAFRINACFRFKRRQVSNYAKDPELGPGYAYIVAWDSYSEYLHRFTDQEEVHHLN